MINVSILVSMLYGLPILWNAQKNKLLKSFSLIGLIKTLNKSLIIHIIFGIISIPIFRLLDSADFKSLDIILTTSWIYILIGIYWYLPLLGILNIIKIVIVKKRKNKTQNKATHRIV